MAGFFEDLPVLMFVLAGVASLVFTGLVSSQSRSEDRLQLALDAAAQSLADDILGRLSLREGSPGSLPSTSTLEQTDFEGIIAEYSNGYRTSIGLARLYPVYGRFYGTVSADDPPIATGYAVRVMDATDESGLVIILELRVVVWK